jgi:hypothetical protein
MKDNWKGEKQFTSWLCICPNNKITGGKVKSSRTMRSNNRLATALRLAAQTVRRSDNILGEYYRRMRGRLGPQKAVTATAHKMARIIYRLVVNQEEYDPEKIRQGEVKTRIHRITYYMKQLKKLGVDRSYFSQAASYEVSWKCRCGSISNRYLRANCSLASSYFVTLLTGVFF